MKTLVKKLTQKEMQCLQLLIDGYRRKEIAKKMNISINTVKSYIFRMKDKFNAKTAEQMVAKACCERHSKSVSDYS